MNFWTLELHPDRKVLPVGKTVYKNEYSDEWYNFLRYIVGFSYEDKLRLHIIERYVERKEEKTYRDSIKNSLLSDYPSLEKVIIGDDVFRSDSSTSSPMKYCQDISLFYEFINGGLEIPEDLKYEDWEQLALYSYDIECDKVPEIRENIELVYRKKPKYSFVEWEIPLKIGEPYADFSLESDNGTVWFYINNVYLMDIYEEIEKQYADPRVTERYSAEQIAELKENMIKATEEHCPRDMRYVVIEYECGGDYYLNFDFRSYLDEDIEVITGGSSSTFFISAKPDKEFGAHGLPLKAAVIQRPVHESVTEVMAELFYVWEKAENS